MLAFKDSIPYKLGQILKLKRQIIDREMKALTLSRAQWQTIAWLNILGLPCLQQALLKGTEFDRGQLARILEKFEQKNLIIRQPLPNDRRSLAIRYTQKGQRLANKVENIMQTESTIMLKGFDKKTIKQLNLLLNRISDNVSEELSR